MNITNFTAVNEKMKEILEKRFHLYDVDFTDNIFSVKYRLKPRDAVYFIYFLETELNVSLDKNVISNATSIKFEDIFNLIKKALGS